MLMRHVRRIASTLLLFSSWFLNITMVFISICTLSPLRRLNSTQGEIRVGPSHQVGHSTPALSLFPILFVYEVVLSLCNYCTLEKCTCYRGKPYVQREAGTLPSDQLCVQIVSPCDCNAATIRGTDDRGLKAETFLQACLLFVLWHHLTHPSYAWLWF